MGLNAEGLRDLFRHSVPYLGIALAALGIGCSWTDAAGSHHLIVGIGFALVSSTNDFQACEVRDVKNLGFLASPEGVSLGWSQRSRIAINPQNASNLVITTKMTPRALEVRNFNPYEHPVRD